MKYRIVISILVVLNLTILVLFQNCGFGKSEDQFSDTSYVNDTLNAPEIFVTQNAPCNNQFANQNTFQYGSTISICIRNAGSNPQYCITNAGTGASQCFYLPTESTWSYSGSSDQWQKTYPMAPSVPYYPVGSYNITVIDTVDNTSTGQANFIVQ